MAKNYMPWIVGGAAAVGAILLVRRSSQASVVPTTFTPAVPAPIPLTPRPTPGTTQPAPALSATDVIIRRLRSSEGAREVFSFQSMMYSWRATEYTPDGVVGPLTRSLIKRVNAVPGGPPPSDVFVPGVLGKALDYLTVYASDVTPRVIPFRLPRDVIDAVNATTHRILPTGPVLQASAA